MHVFQNFVLASAEGEVKINETESLVVMCRHLICLRAFSRVRLTAPVCYANLPRHVPVLTSTPLSAPPAIVPGERTAHLRFRQFCTPTQQVVLAPEILCQMSIKDMFAVFFFKNVKPKASKGAAF
jgi:hypothetical protein